MKTLSIDIETYSDVPLQKTGVYRYVESPDFEILLFAYSVYNQPVQVIDLACGEQIPKEILLALEDEDVIKWAFNATFERICLSRFLGYPTGEYLKPESWRCSMIWSATMGLPLSLEGVGVVLGLEKQKLSEGKDLIKYFCQPCAPTKTNGQRTRNRPFHAPDKWAMFKKYNIRDVETEMGIQQRLAKFPVSALIWEEYHLDQEINDHGVHLDMELVSATIEMDTRSREELTNTMKAITELENPNSVQQMKAWLSDNGLETDTLGKKAVTELLKSAPPKLAQVLTLRQQLAKSSVRKYQAMEKTVCADGRARGMFQFYGTNRTGRFSGRNIQLQNLPQNHLPDLAEARSLVRSGNFDAVELLYEDVPDTLSQLIRTAFIPREGAQFLVADFSAIEARVIAWFAGEKWRQDVFAKGGDIYCASASQMFKVPVKKHGINGHLRQKGKIAELALGYGGSVGTLKAMGNVIFQKTYTDENFNRHTNYGEVDQYMAPDHHEAIISHSDFDAANALVNQRAAEKGIEKGSDKYQQRYAFSGKIICGECGDTFKRRIHSCTTYKYVAWACNTHLKDKESCHMKYVRDDEIKAAFITMLNKLIYGYRLILTPYLKVLENSSGDEAIQRIQHLEQLITQNSEQREALTKLMAQGYIDQILYNQETNALLLQAETYRSDIEAITIGMTGDATKVTETNLLLHFVSHTDMLTAHSEKFFQNYADHIEVMSRNEIRFVMKCGLTFTERIGG